MEQLEERAIEILHMMIPPEIPETQEDKFSEFMRERNQFIICDSGGKDSSVLKHIALKANEMYALALFGDKNARGMVILKTYNEYMKGYEDEHGKHIEGYNELVTRLVNEFPIGSQIIGEDNEKILSNYLVVF